MIHQLLDPFRNPADHHHSGSHPLLTAAAAYVGGELSQRHEHAHRPHLWRNAAIAGAMAYGWHKYKNNHHPWQQASYYPPRQDRSAYYSRPYSSQYGPAIYANDYSHMHHYYRHPSHYYGGRITSRRYHYCQ
ncbi:hypothetical protein BC941DRAFT_466212 [Chlamydoabsidia padenii]|nr:hypothetical protein BC941DRAFT_466212 [Chlamydoabsidia padenii]